MSEARKSDLVDLELCLHAETGKALLVSDDGDKKYAKWLPKSQVEFEHRERGNGMALVFVTLPEWLAIDKGLV